MMMTNKSRPIFALVLFGATLSACGGDEAEETPATKVGFEILQVKSTNEIVVWLGQGITRDEFDALEVPQGWLKNQPRESDPDGGFFARSPGASADGEFTDQEHFGHTWRHNATVLEVNVALDSQGLLRRNTIAKLHTLTYNAGRTLVILASPEGEAYIRVSRDADREVEEPTIPQGWTLLNHGLSEQLTFELPNPTINIRGDNEDSFQGPVEALSQVVAR